MQKIQTDLCILGAGSGGLSVAAAACQMGVKVVLIEPNQMGGECLNTGCVPSKALIHVANQLYAIRHCSELGIQANAGIDFQCVHNYIQQVIANIAPHDSQQRFESLGAKVIREHAHFIDSHTLQTQSLRITAKKIVIATGSSPTIPNIKGLADIDYLTNESIFNLTQLPKQLIIIGGGPIGCELGQAFRLLGSEITILQRREILANDDHDCREVIRQDLTQCGVNLFENTTVHCVTQRGTDIEVIFEQDGMQKTALGTKLLIATGRQANINDIAIERANIKLSNDGVVIDQRCRTSQKHIYAIGDVASPYRFTHAANYQAGIVIRNALFRLPARCNYQAMPHVTYTRLELAQVGITEAIAQANKCHYKVTTMPFSQIDRAIAQHASEGFIKVITNNKSKVLGASIVGHNAGELIIPWIQAVQRKLSIKAMTKLIIPYPTRSDIHKQVAGKYYLPDLTSSLIRSLVRLLF